MTTVTLRVRSIKIDVDRLQAREVAVGHGRFLVTEVLRQSLNLAVIRTPVDFGNLRSHNRIRMAVVRANDVYGELFNDAKYAAAVHDGRAALTIRPRRKKALRFVVDGQVVFARKVRQKARAGRPWLATAARDVSLAEGFVWTRL